jgi:hypothetical protein
LAPLFGEAFLLALELGVLNHQGTIAPVKQMVDEGRVKKGEGKGIEVTNH